jgi:hypothetical protein
MESLVKDIPGGDGKHPNLFSQCSFDHVLILKLRDIAWFYIVNTRGLRLMADFFVPLAKLRGLRKIRKYLGVFKTRGIIPGKSPGNNKVKRSRGFKSYTSFQASSNRMVFY